MRYIFIQRNRPEYQPLMQELQRQLAELHDDANQYEVYVPKGKGNATRYVHIYCDLHPAEKVCFVACGGDGTINEVASGLVGFIDKYMAVFTFGGLGCDFVKYYPQLDFHNLKALISNQPQPIDIIKVNDNYSINVCNFGFDSVVGDMAYRLFERGNKNAFRIGIAWALLVGRFNKIHVEIDGTPIPRRRMLLCTLANGRYVGGEFLCAPRALNSDGLIDVCYIKTMSLLSLLRLLPIYRRGEHLQSPRFSHKCIYRQATHVSVSSRQMISLCLDGEMLPGTQFDIDILPGAIHMVLPTPPEEVQ